MYVIHAIVFGLLSVIFYISTLVIPLCHLMLVLVCYWHNICKNFSGVVRALLGSARIAGFFVPKLAQHP